MGVRRTLNVDDVLKRQDSGELKRRLRGRDLVGFGVGIIIGTGIFTLAGVEAKTHAGPAVTLSFVIGAVVAALAALCYAELASSVPTAGSAYTYAFATLGELFAWIIGWGLLLAIKLAGGVLIIAVGVFFIDAANLTPFIPPATPVPAGGAILEQPVVEG